MGSTFAHCVIALLIASTFAGSCAASRDCPFNNTNSQLKHGQNWWNRPNKTQGAAPNKIIVGGSEKWHFGFNYTDWALKHGPFYINDVLVFKYDPPSNGAHPHSVYVLPDFWSFKNCDLSRARKVANGTQGSEYGYEFKLKIRKTHYFACGESNSIHCNLGLMKFSVLPIPRGWHK
ncbi:hypothetical protein TIFTF001_006915 [Ficus carica]|uniref:Phytocyanin domain-containing protein n=1 Tax=Ficus carica TaxID=3494 RepID=A0AA88A1P0_FICCA|nr:hypothetical protein TIFTF001_006915 [Ficus carica]